MHIGRVVSPIKTLFWLYQSHTACQQLSCVNRRGSEAVNDSGWFQTPEHIIKIAVQGKNASNLIAAKIQALYLSLLKNPTL
jgi:hypothetical protein